jgi:hypothetical protein
MSIVCVHAAQTAHLINTLLIAVEDEWADPEEDPPTTSSAADLLFSALCCCPMLENLKLVDFHFWCVVSSHHTHFRVTY